jgi:hypothetical protein
MSTRPGLNETAANSAIDDIIAGGADVRLMTAEVNYTDTNTDLDSKEVSASDYTKINVAEADWNVTVDAANYETTLGNANEVSFGEINNDWGVVVDAVIQDPSTDEFIISDEPNDPDLTSGETVRFPAGDLSYTLG